MVVNAHYRDLTATCNRTPHQVRVLSTHVRRSGPGVRSTIVNPSGVVWVEGIWRIEGQDGCGRFEVLDELDTSALNEILLKLAHVGGILQCLSVVEEAEIVSREGRYRDGFAIVSEYQLV